MTWIFPFGPYEVSPPKNRRISKDTNPPPTSYPNPLAENYGWTQTTTTSTIKNKPDFTGWKLVENGGAKNFSFTLDVPGFDNSGVEVKLSSERDLLIIRTLKKGSEGATTSTTSYIAEVPWKIHQKSMKIVLETLRAVCKNGQVIISGLLEDEKTAYKSYPVTVTAE